MGKRYDVEVRGLVTKALSEQFGFEVVRRYVVEKAEHALAIAREEDIAPTRCVNLGKTIEPLDPRYVLAKTLAS